MIGIMDYGCGNLASIENALAVIGLPSRRVAQAGDILGLEQLILPGVGHFGHAAACLDQAGLRGILREYAAAGGRLLGICLGMQLLFEGSDEAEEAEGLKLIKGRSRAFQDPALKVPHMGWNQVDFSNGPRAEAYFVHSYYVPAWNGPGAADWLGMCFYGERFLAAFRYGNLAGCQFHPEKSGQWGLKFLKEVLL
jgi:imidazole glycerol phosphate synthase glutamine amidotransferase subunit